MAKRNAPRAVAFALAGSSAASALVALALLMLHPICAEAQRSLGTYAVDSQTTTTFTPTFGKPSPSDKEKGWGFGDCPNPRQLSIQGANWATPIGGNVVTPGPLGFGLAIDLRGLGPGTYRAKAVLTCKDCGPTCPTIELPFLVQVAGSTTFGDHPADAQFGGLVDGQPVKIEDLVPSILSDLKLSAYGQTPHGNAILTNLENNYLENGLSDVTIVPTVDNILRGRFSNHTPPVDEQVVKPGGARYVVNRGSGLLASLFADEEIYLGIDQSTIGIESARANPGAYFAFTFDGKLGVILKADLVHNLANEGLHAYHAGAFNVGGRASLEEERDSTRSGNAAAAALGLPPALERPGEGYGGTSNPDYVPLFLETGSAGAPAAPTSPSPGAATGRPGASSGGSSSDVGKSKDQMKFANAETGEPIDGSAVKVVQTDDDSQDGNTGGPDNDDQNDVNKVNGNGSYVLVSPCKVEQVASGVDLIESPVVELQPKPITIHISYCSEWDAEAQRRARFQLDYQGADSNLDHYDVRSVTKGQQRVGRGPGSGLVVDYCEIVLVPKTAQATASAPACTGATQTSNQPQSTGDAPPQGNDDPSVDSDDTTAPQPGMTEGPAGSDPETPRVEPIGSSHRDTRSQRVPDGPATKVAAVAGVSDGLAGGFANDPFFARNGTWGQPYADQWGLHRIGFSPADPARLRALWPTPAQPVVVAVIDTGVDRFHPDLQGSVWSNAQEIPGNRRDDDANGYVDDVFGWNFANGNGDTRDLNGHGTVVAGIIAARMGNTVGIAGVNPSVRIMPLKVSTWSGSTTNFEIGAAIRYAADNGARVINLSYGGRHRRWTEYLAVAYARQKGVIVVTAAGNDAEEADRHSPGGLPGVITVAATGVKDERLGFSNWGGGVDLAAPGWDILSLRARGTDALKFLRDDYKPGAAIVGEDRRYYRLTGTSFSAPFVTGVASLIWSVRPGLTDMQVMRMLLHSARDIETAGWDQYTGYGLLDAQAALAADPDYYVLARILGAVGKQGPGGTVVAVSGRARANWFKRAWIEAGQGTDPQTWIKVSDDLGQPVGRGVLAEIPANRFRGARDWTLRLIVEHANGTRREARFKLAIG
jgi:subtilisin family serine protease